MDLAQDPAGAHPRLDSTAARVLVADPDAFGGQLIVASLRADGHLAEWVGDGESAVERCSGGQVDLLILELDLPVLHGIRVLRRLSGRDRLRCLVLTSRSLELEHEVLKSGAHTFLAKPFDPEALRIHVRRLIAELAEEVKQRSQVSTGFPGSPRWHT